MSISNSFEYLAIVDSRGSTASSPTSSQALRPSVQSSPSSGIPSPTSSSGSAPEAIASPMSFQSTIEPTYPLQIDPLPGNGVEECPDCGTRFNSADVKIHRKVCPAQHNLLRSTIVNPRHGQTSRSNSSPSAMRLPTPIYAQPNSTRGLREDGYSSRRHVNAPYQPRPGQSGGSSAPRVVGFVGTGSTSSGSSHRSHHWPGIGRGAASSGYQTDELMNFRNPYPPSGQGLGSSSQTCANTGPDRPDTSSDPNFQASSVDLASRITRGHSPIRRVPK